MKFDRAEKDNRMVLLDDAVYKETKEILSGRREKSPLLAKLCAWFSATYGVRVLNMWPTMIFQTRQRWEPIGERRRK